MGETKSKPYKLYNILLGKRHTHPGNVPSALTPTHVSAVRRWERKSQSRVTAAGGARAALAAHCLCATSAQGYISGRWASKSSQILALGSASLSEQEGNDNETTNEKVTFLTALALSQIKQ